MPASGGAPASFGEHASPRAPASAPSPPPFTAAGFELAACGAVRGGEPPASLLPVGGGGMAEAHGGDAGVAEGAAHSSLAAADADDAADAADADAAADAASGLAGVIDRMGGGPV